MPPSPYLCLRQFASHMDWWHKIRRTFTSFSTRIKLRISGGGVAGGKSGGVVEYGGDRSGLLKLRDDVLMCGYKDVEVMWNMLSLSLQPEPIEAAKSQISLRSCNCNCKQRSISRLFFCSNHNT